MDINQIQETTKKRIWQAIAGSGVNVSSIAKADLEKLVDTIAQEMLEEFDEVVGQSAVPPQLQAVGSRPGDVPAEEEVLWEGRPFLSLVEYYVITQPARARHHRPVGPRLREHRAGADQGFGLDVKGSASGCSASAISS